jgi:hypothetical protein
MADPLDDAQGFGDVFQADQTTPTPSSIDAERTKRLKAEGKYDGQNRWGDFFKSVGWRLLWTVVFAIVTANFIYLTSNEYLDIILPTDERLYFPKFNPTARTSTFSSSSSSATKGGSYENCNPLFSKEPKPFIIGKNFPYNLVDKEDGNWDFMQSFKNWFATTTAHTFITGRKIVKDFFEFFKPPGLFSYQPLQIFVGAPVAMLMTFIVFIFGCISSFFFAFQDGPMWTIVGLFALYTWGICFCEGLMYALKYVSLLVFYGASNNWEGLKDIIGCNVRYYVMFFGWLITGAAFDYLDPTISIMMAIGFLGMCVKLLWTDVKGFVNM